MIQAGVALQWLVAIVLSVALVVSAFRRWPEPPWARLGVAAVLLVNLAVVTPNFADSSAEPSNWLLALALVSWLVVVFTFPDGRSAPAWTGWVLLAGSMAIVVAPLVGGTEPLRTGAFALAFAVGAGSQVWRYQRRLTVDERQATKWLLAGLVPATAVFIGTGLVVSTTNLSPEVFEEPLYLAASLAGIWIVPIGGAIGLLGGRGWPVDPVVHFLIVAAGVALFASWTYFGSIGVVGSTWSAVLAAILVLPLRFVFSRLATTVVYGRQQSPVGLLARQLEGSVNHQDVAALVAQTVSDALALPYAAVRFNGQVVAEVKAGPGEHDSGPSLEVFPVDYLGKRVAEIAVAPRFGDVVIQGRDREALQRLATSSGPALHGAVTLRELSRARERLVFAREEERRRLRRDLHDDLAPTLAGLSLRAAAASALADVDSERASYLLADVQDGVQAAIAQVRQLAYDLRPPILDDHGLEAAIRDRLATQVDSDLALVVEVRDLPEVVPAAVELAALRIVQEAVTNVRKHAGASSCTVKLMTNSRNLLVEVWDDGRGFQEGHVRGIGLRSMEERTAELGGGFRINSNPEEGTTLSVRLPLQERDIGEGTDR